MYRYNKHRAYRGEGGDKEVHLLIPGCGHPGINTPPQRGSHNDWGFRLTEKGQWDVTYADFGLAQAKELENKIKGEVALMKAKAIAKMRGYSVTGQSETDNEKYIDIRIDTSSLEEIT